MGYRKVLMLFFLGACSSASMAENQAELNCVYHYEENQPHNVIITELWAGEEMNIFYLNGKILTESKETQLETNTYILKKGEVELSSGEGYQESQICFHKK